MIVRGVGERASKPQHDKGVEAEKAEEKGKNEEGQGREHNDGKVLHRAPCGQKAVILTGAAQSQ